MRQIVIAGGPGSGKSRLARKVAVAFNLSHLELDALWWEPGWKATDRDRFRESVREAIRDPGWVVDGNYLGEVAQDIVWASADTLIWLDPPRWVAVRRTLRRAASRIVRRTELWGTNTQGISTLSPRSVLRLIRRWPRYSSEIEALLERGDFTDLVVVRIRNDDELAEWLAREGVS